MPCLHVFPSKHSSSTPGACWLFPNWQRVSDTLPRHGVEPVRAEALARAEPQVKFAIDSSLASDPVNRSEALERLSGRSARHGGGAASHSHALTPNTSCTRITPSNNLWEQVPADVVAALGRLRALGLKLAIASNANGSLSTARSPALASSPFFDTICDSHLEGVEKPQPRFFRIVLERSRSQAETTLHVGDLYHVDIVGARNTGIAGDAAGPARPLRRLRCGRVRSLDELVDRLELPPGTPDACT